jgi:putative phosphonate metabolism protein
MNARYAIYFAPGPRTLLWRTGCEWVGRDAETNASLAQPVVTGFSAQRLRALTQAPRLYGFHATLKPPFHLSSGQSLEGLRAALRRFAAERAVFPLPPLQVGLLSGFAALRPATAAAALERLAADCVHAFDAFRRPPTRSELERRRQAALTPRQEALLLRYGYPYVLDEFRFHITLTERLDDDDAARLVPWLVQHFFAALRQSAHVMDLCLFAQDRPGTAFRILERFPLSLTPQL